MAKLSPNLVNLLVVEAEKDYQQSAGNAADYARESHARVARSLNPIAYPVHFTPGFFMLD
jgi:hypothetical protein